MAAGRLAGAHLGVWLVGARGAVATATIVGAAALRRGLVAPDGMVTAHEPFSTLPLAPLATLAFGGHDLRGGSLVDRARALVRDGALDRDVVEAVADDLERVAAHIRPAPRPSDDGAPAREIVRAIQRDLAAFASDVRVVRTVVVNLASTEPHPPPHPAHGSLAVLERALDEAPAGDPALPPSLLYAYAALDAGCPYVNFTPSIGAAAPALEELARARGVAHAGRDGKTGETLLKSVLAPMFAMRRLRVRSWSGLNLLGNDDGRTLADPAACRSKLDTKGAVVPAILGYEVDGPVRIEYVASFGDRKTAWDLVQFEGFMGSPMSVQLVWQASDSALAAPLVLDLARLVHLAADRNERGALGHLAFFFKAPLGADVHDLFGQHALMRAHLGC